MEEGNIISIYLLLYGYPYGKRKILKMINEEKQLSNLSKIGILFISKLIEYNTQLIK